MSVAVSGHSGHAVSFRTSEDVSGEVEDLNEGGGRELTPLGIVEFAVSHFTFGGPFSSLYLPVDYENPKEIAEYLVKNPKANEAVEQTYVQVDTYFPNSDFRLKLQESFGASGKKLALFVETTDEPNEALSKLEQFDQNFWIGHLGEYDPYLQVHLEYQ